MDEANLLASYLLGCVLHSSFIVNCRFLFISPEQGNRVTSKLKARIVGTGSYLPQKVLTNHDLERLVDTSDEWIVTRTGMKERRIAAEDEHTSDMGAAAALRALENAGRTVADIDLILVATMSPDHPIPSTASFVQRLLGAKGAAAADIQAACTGYIYGLSMAKAYIESGMYRNVLLVASEKMSAIIDYTDRNTSPYCLATVLLLLSFQRRAKGFTSTLFPLVPTES
jgi:3-oxoacyl-[acyl-carrier-protein] synthase III